MCSPLFSYTKLKTFREKENKKNAHDLQLSLYTHFVLQSLHILSISLVIALCSQFGSRLVLSILHLNMGDGAVSTHTESE